MLHNTAQTQYFTKNSNSNIFLTNTINTTAQSTAVFSTIAHLLFHNRCQFSHIFLMVIEQFTLFIAQCCLNNWFEVLSTCVTLKQSLVSQLIGTNKQFSSITISKGIKAKVKILLNSNKAIHFIHNSFMFSSKLLKFR